MLMLDKLRAHFSSRDFKWFMFAIAVLGVFLCTSFLIFASPGVVVRITAVTVMPYLILGLAIITGGLFVRRMGYILLGLGLTLFGAANLSTHLRFNLAHWQRLWVALVILADIACLLSVAVQWKERGR